MAILIFQQIGCSENVEDIFAEAEQYRTESEDLSLPMENRRQLRDLAIKEYSRAIIINKDNGSKKDQALSWRGELYLRNRDCQSAVEDFSALISKGKSNARLLLMRGQCYDRMQMLDQALNDYTKAISLGAQGVVFEYRGRLYFQLGRHVDAIKDFSEFLQTQPNSSSVLESRGDAFVLAGSKKNAIQDYKAALAVVRSTASEVFGQSVSRAENNPDEVRLVEKINRLGLPKN